MNFYEMLDSEFKNLGKEAKKLKVKREFNKTFKDYETHIQPVQRKNKSEF